MPKQSVCAELGVFCGDFSDQILHVTDPKKLFLVDLFHGLTISGDEHGNNVRTVDMGRKRFELDVKYQGKHVSIVKSESYEWLLGQGQSTLDWIYIDTTHEFEQTMHELLGAMRVVKPNGFICGHDYAEKYFGVVKAVNLFVRHYSLDLSIYDGDGLASFCIVNGKAF
jgi:hypothetical protein